MPKTCLVLPTAMTKMRVLRPSGSDFPVLFTAPNPRYSNTLLAPVFWETKTVKTLLDVKNIKDKPQPGSQRLATISGFGTFSYVADCDHSYHFRADSDFCIRQDKDYPHLNE